MKSTWVYKHSRLFGSIIFYTGLFGLVSYFAFSSYLMFQTRSFLQLLNPLYYFYVLFQLIQDWPFWGLLLLAVVGSKVLSWFFLLDQLREIEKRYMILETFKKVKNLDTDEQEILANAQSRVRDMLSKAGYLQ